MTLKIHFSNVNWNSRNGPSSFASRIAEQFKSKDIEIVDKNSNYDIFLAFFEPSSQPRPGCKIVQRLDGIWTKPEEFLTRNKLIKFTYEHAHHTIWQSEFDKNMTVCHWGKRTGTIIHNGILLEKKEVTNDELLKIRNRYDHIFVSSANWHRQKRLKENIELFLKIKEKMNNSCLLVLGRDVDYNHRGNDVWYTGSIPHEICLQIYSMADWMIHLAWLDHCPNVVVEAISQECPVICSSSGGTKEIVKNNGLIITENQEYNYELVDYDDPPPLKLNNFNLPSKPMINNSYLNIDNTAEKYIKVFKSILG